MKGKLNGIFKEAKRDYKIISKTYKILVKSFDKKIQMHSAGQWILDNMYIIEEQYNDIIDNKRVLKNKKLPMIRTHNGQKCVAIFYLAYELVENNTGYVDKNIIFNCLREHQKLTYLSSEELDLFVLMVKIALLKFIARIAINVSNSQMKKFEVEKILDNDNETDISKDLHFFKGINKDSKLSDLTKIKNTNTAFVEYMSYRLKEMGTEGEKYYNQLQDEISKLGFSIEEAIVKEHMEIAKTTDYMGRAISSFKVLQALNFREIFEAVNKIDETLMDDYTDEFKKCDYKTKARYRDYIIKLAQKYDLSEVYVAKKAVECSKKYKKHVGFFLIGDQKYLLKEALGKSGLSQRLLYKVFVPVRQALFVATLLLIAIILTIFTYNYLNPQNVFLKICGVIIPFSFYLEFADKIVNYIIRKTVKPKILPRFNFSKTIDENNKTYVVMPTIISSLDKLDKMIEKMEVTYLANMSNNMYYMLLGDCCASNTKEIKMDKDIVEYAKKRLDELNKKYPTEDGHVLFNFMYRKRVYSKGESAYMGWERKRGGLMQFNWLVLGKLSQKQINDSMYLIYDDIVRCKYAITIDEDTELSLNSAKELVAIMAHPLNKPRLNKKKTRVIEGFGLIQPAVSLDIESANRSLFSKLFGGFGGIDVYTNAISNTYQDAFQEAIFCGKGIYDIALFERLVAPEIPENLVLSHDLLEGSIIKAGLASDVDVQDGFPNNYIAYMKRNHRWYRGDMQIIRWLLNPKSKLSILSKWKIFDNIRRPMLDVIVLFAILVSLFISSKAFIYTVFAGFITVNIGYFISFIDILIYGRRIHKKELQYIPLIHGLGADLLTMVYNFITIPYKSYICLSAFSLSIYRMLISHKKLLEWTTGEMLEKQAKSKLSFYYRNMVSNVIVALVIALVPFALNTSNIVLIDFKMFIAIAFALAPFLTYLLGKDHLFGRIKKLDKTQEKDIMDIAKRTWGFFDSMMNDTNNYLPTDNFQENRRYKIANRTSSTNIGFGIMAIIDAYDLGFITKENAIERLVKIYKTIMKLEKWHGHLYNWYNIKTLEPLRPRFVSTVDSGNFISILYVAKEFFNTERNKLYNYMPGTNVEKFTEALDELLQYTQRLIDETDFKALYCPARNLFSIGFDIEQGTLVDSYYDMLMSENRITSLVAIAKKDVSSKHWFALARNMVDVDGYKGLMSWAGTTFEYFMPYLFMKSYEYTLIDQSMFFCEYSQMKYAKKYKVPFGISESAYAKRDTDLNYQYKSFGIPWLGLKRGLNSSLVVAPYASILMLEFAPKKVHENLEKLKKLGMYSSFGFYESIDYTKEHLHDNVDYEVIKTYMAHHQGMALTAINNYINNGIVRNRFHSDEGVKAAEILLKERERVNVKIQKKAKDKEHEFKQKDVNKYTTHVSYTYAEKKYATLNDASTQMNIAFLRGSRLSSIITNTGASYIKYKDKLVNRQSYSNPDESGNYIYITDLTAGKTISTSDCNIHSRYNKDTESCKWVSSLNKVECHIKTSEIEVNTDICVSQEFNVELRKVSIYNTTKDKREILINTYIEPAMTDYMTNLVHPSFANLQIETYYDKELDTLVASKRKRSDDENDLFVFSRLVGVSLDKDFETEKKKLYDNDESAYNGELTRYPLWPVLSHRGKIILDPYERQEFYYIVGASDTKYKISNAVVNLNEKGIEDQFKLTAELNSVIARYLNLEPTKAEIYNNILKDVLFNKKNLTDNEAYWNESLNQSLLWKYSISGDLPIILVFIDNIKNAGIITEVIKFMDYVKNRKIDLDIVVIIDEKIKENGPVYTYVRQRLDRAVYMDYTKGNIYILNLNSLTKQEFTLLSFLSKRYIKDVSDFLYVSKKEDKIENLLEE
ncbi:MAG: glucoamylase family protein [Clostridia bacterium]